MTASGANNAREVLGGGGGERHKEDLPSPLPP